MKINQAEQVRKDITESFAFVRYLIDNPAALKQIKNGSEIRIVPAARAKTLRLYRLPKKVQAFVAETVFHSL